MFREANCGASLLAKMDCLLFASFEIRQFCKWPCAFHNQGAEPSRTCRRHFQSRAPRAIWPKVQNCSVHREDATLHWYTLRCWALTLKSNYSKVNCIIKALLKFFLLFLLIYSFHICFILQDPRTYQFYEWSGYPELIFQLLFLLLLLWWTIRCFWSSCFARKIIHRQSYNEK